MEITRQISNYNYSSRNGTGIKYIVMHDTGNYKDTASANSNYFNTGDRQASAHYFIDEDSIYQVVEDYNYSWHCGDGRGSNGITNANSIGIEMCNSGGFISESTIENTLELVRQLQAKYNIPSSQVLRHFDASGKVCPNNLSQNNWAKWKEFKERLDNLVAENSDVKVAVPQMDSHITQSDKRIIEEEGAYMSKKYQNGSTRENVYSDYSLSNKIGSLDPWESCKAIQDLGNRIVVLYNTPSTQKTGFVAYRGGL